MTKIKIILNKIRINEPEMLTWALIPLVMLIVATNYIFNSNKNEILTEQKSYVAEFNYQEKEKEIRKNNKDYIINQNLPAVSILFLGATKNQFEIAYPIIRANGLVANLSIPTSEIGNFDSKMNWQNLLLLQNQSWGMISQSKDQVCDVEKLKDINIVKSEIQGSKEELIKRGIYTNVYIAPCGIVNNLVKQEVPKIYSGLITFGNTNNQKISGSNYNLIAKTITNENYSSIEKTITNLNNSKSWTILAIPEIGNGNGYELSQENLIDIIVKLKTMGVQFVTLEQVLKL